MDCFLRLPPDLLHVTILSFLLMKDFVALDTATCNASQRSEYQQRLKNVVYRGFEDSELLLQQMS